MPALPKLERAPSIESMHLLRICLWCYEGNRDAPKESMHSWDIDRHHSHSLRLPSPYMAGANAEWHSPWENSETHD